MPPLVALEGVDSSFSAIFVHSKMSSGVIDAMKPPSNQRCSSSNWGPATTTGGRVSTKICHLWVFKSDTRGDQSDETSMKNEQYRASNETKELHSFGVTLGH